MNEAVIYVFLILAYVASVIMTLAPVRVLMFPPPGTDLSRQKISVLPYVASAVQCCFWLSYALTSDPINTALIPTNVFAIFMQVVYCIIGIYKSQKLISADAAGASDMSVSSPKSATAKMVASIRRDSNSAIVAVTLALMTLIYLTVELAGSSARTEVYGYLALVTNCLLFLAPAVDVIALVFFKKHVLVQYDLILGGLVAASLWMLWAIFAGQFKVIIPNAFGVVTSGGAFLLGKSAKLRRRESRVGLSVIDSSSHSSDVEHNGN